MKVKEGTAELDYASEKIKDLLDATGQIPPLDKGTFHAQLPLPSIRLSGLVTGRPIVGNWLWICSLSVGVLTIH